MGIVGRPWWWVFKAPFTYKLAAVRRDLVISKPKK